MKPNRLTIAVAASMLMLGGIAAGCSHGGAAQSGESCSKSSDCPASDICDANYTCTAKKAGQCHDDGDCSHGNPCNPVTNECMQWFTGTGGGGGSGGGGGGGGAPPCDAPQGECAVPAQCGDWVPLIAVPEGAPPSAKGGIIADGTYVATSATLYVGPGSGASGQVGQVRWTMTIAQGAIAFNLESQSQDGQPAVLAGSGAFQADGTGFLIDPTCPAGLGPNVGTYTASGDTLELVDLNDMLQTVVTILVRQ